MQACESLSFRTDGRIIEILDQTQLPQKKIWLDVTSPEAMIESIRRLQVRGAPLIGVAAAFCLARLAELGVSRREYLQVAQKLREARPTAVNLMAAMDRMIVPTSISEIVHEAESIFFEDIKMCHEISANGAELIKDGDQVLTHCNTGGLATAGVGTAIGILRYAHQQKKKIHVFVDETRPLLQGGRLTAWEMGELTIPYTLICDSMAALLMQNRKISSVIVGCDRIARNGDFANKVGTYNLAVLAKHHRIPFYVAGPMTTVDLQCESGQDIPIEERSADEVRGVNGAFGKVIWSPLDAPVFNPAFDVTPAELVTAWILDVGVFRSAKELSKVIFKD